MQKSSCQRADATQLASRHRSPRSVDALGNDGPWSRGCGQLAPSIVMQLGARRTISRVWAARQHDDRQGGWRARGGTSHLVTNPSWRQPECIATSSAASHPIGALANSSLAAFAASKVFLNALDKCETRRVLWGTCTVSKPWPNSSKDAACGTASSLEAAPSPCRSGGAADAAEASLSSPSADKAAQGEPPSPTQSSDRSAQGEPPSLTPSSDDRLAHPIAMQISSVGSMVPLKSHMTTISCSSWQGGVHMCIIGNPRNQH